MFAERDTSSPSSRSQLTLLLLPLYSRLLCIHQLELLLQYFPLLLQQVQYLPELHDLPQLLLQRPLQHAHIPIQLLRLLFLLPIFLCLQSNLGFFLGECLR